ncbi:uncharacterized protein LOC143361434 [Halictus rubicundus]|uniref:uncharacterized protein LOC143361434 n=1 Tax=Halictus rubicundus TaxID=77578 RepID=UPI00403624AF
MKFEGRSTRPTIFGYVSVQGGIYHRRQCTGSQRGHSTVRGWHLFQPEDVEDSMESAADDQGLQRNVDQRDRSVCARYKLTLVVPEFPQISRHYRRCHRYRGAKSRFGTTGGSSPAFTDLEESRISLPVSRRDGR